MYLVPRDEADSVFYVYLPIRHPSIFFQERTCSNLAHLLVPGLSPLQSRFNLMGLCFMILTGRSYILAFDDSLPTARKKPHSLGANLDNA